MKKSETSETIASLDTLIDLNLKITVGELINLCTSVEVANPSFVIEYMKFLYDITEEEDVVKIVGKFGFNTSLKLAKKMHRILNKYGIFTKSEKTKGV